MLCGGALLLTAVALQMSIGSLIAFWPLILQRAVLAEAFPPADLV